MEVLQKLGIDWKLLLAQGVNFLILLYILKRFVYKPMLAFLDERSAKIDSGLQNAEAATKRLEAAEKEQESVLASAQKKAREITEEALAAAKRRDAEQLEKTKAEIERMLQASEEAIAGEKERMMREAKAELAELVLTATQKLTGATIDQKKHDELVQKSLT